MEDSFLDKVKIGRVERFAVFLTAVLSILLGAWAMPGFVLVILWVVFNNRRPIESAEARTIDLSIRKRIGILLIGGSAGVLMLVAAGLQVFAELELYQVLFDPQDLEALSLFGLYNHGAPFFEDLFDLGYRQVAVVSKFSEFVMRSALICIIFCLFLSIVRISVFMSNIKVVGKKKVIFLLSCVLYAPLYVILSDSIINMGESTDGFVEKYTNQHNLNALYFYGTAFKFWFILSANVIVTIPLLGKIFLLITPSGHRA